MCQPWVEGELPTNPWIPSPSPGLKFVRAGSGKGLVLGKAWDAGLGSPHVMIPCPLTQEQPNKQSCGVPQLHGESSAVPLNHISAP